MNSTYSGLPIEEPDSYTPEFEDSRMEEPHEPYDAPYKLLIDYELHEKFTDLHSAVERSYCEMRRIQKHLKRKMAQSSFSTVEMRTIMGRLETSMLNHHENLLEMYKQLQETEPVKL